MDQHQLKFRSAADIRSDVTEGRRTVEDVVTECLDLIGQRNPELNCVVARRDEAALDDARAADQLDPAAHGPLHGVPVLIKDLNETIDMPTTFGAQALSENMAVFEALAVSRLRSAGAIVVGKTSTSEFGLRPTIGSALFGPTINPMSPQHTTGGSSGGAASALAAGIVPIALGGDGGGSCRIPASCCHIVGMCPSRGRVPWAPAAYEYWGALATNGPMGRSVQDVQTMLDVMAGPVVGEPYGVSTVSASDDAEAGPWKIGVLLTPPHGSLNPEVESAVLDAAEVFRRLGHDVDVATVDLGGLRRPWEVVVQASAAMTVEHVIGDTGLASLEANTLALAMRGVALTAADYAYAIHTMRSRSAEVMQSMDHYDAVLTPTLTDLPPRQESVLDSDTHDVRWERYLDWLAFTYPTNCTGQPAISLPATLSGDGRPIGIQLVGRMGDDARLLRIASAFESSQPWSHLYAHAS